MAVFADYKTAASELAPHGIVNVYPLAEFGLRAAQQPSSSSAILVATGHGVFDGIGETACEISPAAALAAIRSVPGMTFGVAILGQCFGGVFNYTDADVAGEAPLAVIGATSLNLSLSGRIPNRIATGVNLPNDWSANLFLYYFFGWLNAPTDVDGDGRVTLIDGYKYAGTRSSSAAAAVKNARFLQATALAPRVQRLLDAYREEDRKLRAMVANSAVSPDKVTRQMQATQKARLALETDDRILATLLATLHTQQDAWVLNARFARRISLWSA